MIFGIGTDLVDIKRIDAVYKNHGSNFLKKILCPIEIKELKTNKNPVRVCAKRFAAKEAFAKALGTGIAHNLSWQDIQITHTDKGKPNIVINSLLKKLFFQQWGNHEYKIDLSISDTQNQALAFVVISKQL